MKEKLFSGFVLWLYVLLSTKLNQGKLKSKVFPMETYYVRGLKVFPMENRLCPRTCYWHKKQTG